MSVLGGEAVYEERMVEIPRNREQLILSHLLFAVLVNNFFSVFRSKRKMDGV